MAGSDALPEAESWRWGDYLLSHCPICGGAELHGHPHEPDPMVRTSHCIEGPRGEYRLVVHPGPPPRWLRAIREKMGRPRVDARRIPAGRMVSVDRLRRMREAVTA